jgi:hypothetical protein
MSPWCLQEILLTGKSDSGVAASLHQALPARFSAQAPQGISMTKAISAFLILAMIVQVIRPLGLPGLRQRSDFWKLAVVAFVTWSVTLLIRP